MPVTHAPTVYTGRFAPSPTGPLHFGSLVAALASYLDARAHKGRWLVRIEDIDPPREVPGASRAILESLQRHGLHQDDTVLFQHDRYTAYQSALNRMLDAGYVYACSCSRQMLARGEACECRTKKRGNPHTPFALKLSFEHVSGGIREIQFQDIFCGVQKQQPAAEGDFVLKRKDGLYAYQLAVVVDDIFQGITHVIRGSDLLSSTGRQLLLFHLLGRNAPAYGHIPLVLNEKGQKLSKQNKALPLDNTRASNNLVDALRFLGQNPPAVLEREKTGLILQWGIEHWSREGVSLPSNRFTQNQSGQRYDDVTKP